MRQSSSYQTDTASAFPESPKEGDFSSRQLYDNLKSLEEHGTCDDQKDPIVNIIPDNYSSCLLNTQISAPLSTNDLEKLCAGALPQEEANKKRELVELQMTNPVSLEFMEGRVLDGRFITLVSSQTQTDWEWVEQSLSFSCQVQKEIEELLLQAEVASADSVPESSEAERSWQKLIAVWRGYNIKGGEVIVNLFSAALLVSRFSLNIERELLQNKADFVRPICCEQAKQTKELSLKEREKLAQIESDKNNNVIPRASIMSEEEQEIAKLSKEIPYINDEPHIPQIDIKNTTGMFTLQAETDGKPKPKVVTKKFYKSGNCFLTLCPDGMGNVFDPSGRAAIIITSAEAADFTYIILEDKDAPSMTAIFANKGHSTSYHPSGMMWLNLTLVGGLCFSETGDLRRRWNWLYFDPHAHKLPSKPLTFALCPHISVRIHSQEHMCKTFTHQKNTVRFSVGSELKSVPKNMKSELEISPDNEVLSSLSKETPQTPTSCQGETEQSLTNLDKLNTALNTARCYCPSFAMSMCAMWSKCLRTHVAARIKIVSLFCCKKAWTLSEVLPKGAVVIAKEPVSDRTLVMQKDQRMKGSEAERSSHHQSPKAGYTHYPPQTDNSCGYILLFFSLASPMTHLTTLQDTMHPPPDTALRRSGQIFNVILPGRVGYASGRLVLVRTAQSTDSYESFVLVLEDHEQQPGQGTRCHNIGFICWLDNKHHGRLNQAKGLMLPGPDMFQTYLQQKSAEINVLLQNIQSLITYQKTVSPQKVKP
ncbi:hypothetical protein Q8A73_009966 [Channa argus]|nr:hypothetical protein Q8A73_009966 [Channa argus]